MVGEIRDNETANLAIQAALTGHIVLSTLHTNNAIGVIPRLMDMKIEPFLLPVSLNLMVSQRLVGSLCSHCKTIVDVSPEAALVIEKALAGLPPDLVGEYKAPYKTYRATGCAKCHERGVIGRVGIFEVLQMSPAIELAVNEGPTVQKLAKIAKEQGMVTLRQDGVLKALAGLISLEEVIRTTDEG
jgi:type IV pilus assembly protein PilB